MSTSTTMVQVQLQRSDPSTPNPPRRASPHAASRHNLILAPPFTHITQPERELVSASICTTFAESARQGGSLTSDLASNTAVHGEAVRYTLSPPLIQARRLAGSPAEFGETILQILMDGCAGANSNTIGQLLDSP